MNESEALGCDLAGVIPDDTDSVIDNDLLDDDGDDVINRDDKCPDTPSNVPVSDDGCSTEQRNSIATPSADSGTDFGATLMALVMMGGIVLAAGAYLILRNIESEGEEVKDLITIESQNLEALANGEMDSDNWEMPVLDGSGTPDSPGRISPADLARCPGWSEETIQTYLDQGWPMDELAAYYQQQVDENS